MKKPNTPQEDGDKIVFTPGHEDEEYIEDIGFEPTDADFPDSMFDSFFDE